MPTKEYCDILSGRISKLEERFDDLLKEVTLLEIETRGKSYNCQKHVELLEHNVGQIRKELAPVVAHCKVPDQRDCGFCKAVRKMFVAIFGNLK